MDQWQFVPVWDERTSLYEEIGGYFLGRKRGTHIEVPFDADYIMENAKQVVAKSMTELDVTNARTFFTDLKLRACREWRQYRTSWYQGKPRERPTFKKAAGGFCDDMEDRKRKDEGFSDAQPYLQPQGSRMCISLAVANMIFYGGWW